MVTASEMNRLRRPVAPAVRLLDSHSSTPLGASPPGPPVASPILAGSTTSPQMCRRRRGAVPEAKTQGVGLRGGQASRAGGTAPRRAASSCVALILAAALTPAACGRSRETQLFELLSPERTGVTFANRLPDDTAFNILTYMYFYDGGGVAVGDVNNDGLPDLYFTSNVGPNRLYLNKGDYRFEDVTERAGVADPDGWKTGVTMADVNGDGYLDLYIANDFQEDDFLYYNNCDGTFTEAIATSVGHTSHASMGVDAADLNNDGRPDLMVLDMLPDQEKILKTSANAESFDAYLQKLETGYHPQYARNTLQLNRGERRFSEIGYLAGVYATDWSWAPLFADLDNDGYKDLFITNGIYRRPNDLDYLAYVSNPVVQASLRDGLAGFSRALIRKMPQVPIANYAYHNNRDLTFTNQAQAWGLGQRGFSNGAAYVDLNNSGALDLVVNRIDAPAAIYRNRARELTKNHYLQVVLRGSGANTAGIGAKVVIRQGGKGGTGGTMQMLEQMPTRGFQSSVDPRLHFGLGEAAQIDSLIVIWPDRRIQVLTDLALDRTLTLSQQDARGAGGGSPPTAGAPLAPPAAGPHPRPPLPSP